MTNMFHFKIPERHLLRSVDASIIVIIQGFSPPCSVLDSSCIFHVLGAFCQFIHFINCAAHINLDEQFRARRTFR